MHTWGLILLQKLSIAVLSAQCPVLNDNTTPSVVGALRPVFSDSPVPYTNNTACIELISGCGVAQAQAAVAELAEDVREVGSLYVKFMTKAVAKVRAAQSLRVLGLS